LFEGRKINKLLEQFRTSEDKLQKVEIISELQGYGMVAFKRTIDAFQHRKITSSDAQFILGKLCNDSCLDIMVMLIGDPYDEVRRVAKELIVKRWPHSSAVLLAESLKSPDIYSRNNAVELLSKLQDKACEAPLISMFNPADTELKKNIIKVLSKVGGREGRQLIVRALRENSTGVRLQAVKSLTKLKEPDSVEPLMRLLEEREPQIRSFAIDALKNLADKRATRPILELLKDDDLLLRQKATDALIEISDADIVPDVINLLRSGDVDVRRCAVEVLKQMKDPNTSTALMDAIKDSDWWVRQIATDSLISLEGSNIVNGFVLMLDDDDENVRRCAVEFFVQVQDMSAFDGLIRRLDDEDWWVREKAVTALGKLKSADAVGPLVNLLEDHETGKAVPNALADIGGETVLQPLRDCLYSGRKQIQIAAIRAMEVLQNPELADDLQQCLADPSEDVRNAAVHTLKVLTGKFFRTRDKEDSPRSMQRRKITTEATVTEAIVVIDLCNSTDIASRFGDNFSLKLMEKLGSVVNPIAEREKYQFMKGTGDGFLITFVTIENAVRFCLKVLMNVQKINETVDENQKINLRFAINFGEARIDQNGDRLGSAVNMTFRVEGVNPGNLITAKGGMKKEEMPLSNRILVTENVEIELEKNPGIITKLVGFFELKGIPGLHRIYHLSLDNIH